MRAPDGAIPFDAGHPAGTVLGERFVVQGTLGRGGFAFAYDARDLELGDACVVKELAPAGVSRDPDGTLRLDALGADRAERLRQRFLEEAATIGRLKAPGVLPIRASFRAFGTAYFATDTVPGAETLQDLLDREGHLPPDSAMDIVYQLMETLDAVHVQGYLHRDVKPSNVLIDPRGRCTLIDFGAAREWIADHADQHTVLYTPGYAPLEQLSERSRRGPATDLYALCATAYHMITGRIPTSAADRAAGMPLESLEALRPGIDPSIAHAMEAGLRLRYDERPPDVSALGELLAATPRVGGPRALEACDEVRTRLNAFKWARNACPGCEGPLDHPRPARSGTCPVCRGGQIRARDLAANRCPHCTSGVLHPVDNTGPLSVCPACGTGRLSRPRRGHPTCPDCGAEFDMSFGGATLLSGPDTVRHPYAEWRRLCDRSEQTAWCDVCPAQFDLLADGRWRQVVPDTSKWGALFAEEWARVAAGFDPEAGNAECDRCGAEYFREDDATTLIGAPTDPFGFAGRHSGRRLDNADLPWMAAGKESAHPGPTCAKCGTEFDRADTYLRLVRSTHPSLARHAGRPLSLEDWHRLANGLPTVAEEPAFEVQFDAAMQAAYRDASLPFDSREPHLLWRSRAARLAQGPGGLEIAAEGRLTITESTVVFAFGLKRWRVPFDALLDVFERDEAVWLSLASYTEPTIFEVEDTEWTTLPASGKRTILLGAHDLAARLRVARGLRGP